jgi:hypothetical protein
MIGSAVTELAVRDGNGSNRPGSNLIEPVRPGLVEPVHPEPVLIRSRFDGTGSNRFEPTYSRGSENRHWAGINVGF